jgi:hypothetical protein
MDSEGPHEVVRRRLDKVKIHVSTSRLSRFRHRRHFQLTMALSRPGQSFWED